jgi:hypothetical protein
MTGNEIRQKYLEYMAKNGHAVVPSAALVPDNASVGRAYGRGPTESAGVVLSHRLPFEAALSFLNHCALEVHRFFFLLTGSQGYGSWTSKVSFPSLPSK